MRRHSIPSIITYVLCAWRDLAPKFEKFCQLAAYIFFLSNSNVIKFLGFWAFLLKTPLHPSVLLDFVPPTFETK